MNPTNLDPLPVMRCEAVRQQLRQRHEIALVDLREEDPYAQAHPLFAVQLASGRIELDAPWRLPRRDTLIVVYDDGQGLAEPGARKLQALGYRQVRLLERDAAGSGLAAWRESGGELFRDVNVPSKAFGELVEHARQTPSLPAEAVKALIDGGADMVVLDARRFDEFQTMSIPGGTSVPGAELLLRVRDLAPDPRTQVIVNCAGRTRSLIGAQSLVNAGIPNPVAALRNGTIGWTLAGLTLAHGQQRQFGPASAGHLALAQVAAQALADRAGALRLRQADLAQTRAEPGRTTYCWDVRSPSEYAAGHLPGFGSAPGGQLVQETDVFAAVRGARIVLVDGGRARDGVRAPMTAHWLAQMGWQVAWLVDADPADFIETGPWRPASGMPDGAPLLGLDALAQALASGSMGVLDLGSSAQHVQAHLPGAQWVLRNQVALAMQTRPALTEWLLVCADGLLSAWAAAELRDLGRADVWALAGGLAAWRAAGRPVEAGDRRLFSPRIDRYRRPYEGTDAPRSAMQAYLDWEFGLVAQLAADATHGFQVLPAA